MPSNLFPTPHSCQHCQRLVLYEDQFSSLEGPDMYSRRHSREVEDWLDRVLLAEIEPNNRRGASFHGGVIFEFTLAEVREAARDGCTLCISIIGDGKSRTDIKEENWLLAAKVSNTLVRFGVPIIEKEKDYHRIPILQKKEDHIIVIEPFTRNSSFDFLPIPITENFASENFSTRPINTTPSSKETFGLARGWLQTCLETHHMCPKPKDDFMPSRLIEIVRNGGRRYLRLCETSSGVATKVEPYAALSYCWGGEQHITTNNKTILRHRSRINMQDLPKTLRDAIIVTEELGFGKVWIDALCIIQDDTYDKAFEIAQMPLVYSRASVTITASRATSVQEGFLQDRPCIGNETPNLVFEMPYRNRDGELGSVVLVPPIEKTVEPLELRAWSLQERLMSPRILEYGSLQLRWICQGNQEYKVLTDGFSNGYVYNSEGSDGLFRATSQLILSPENLVSMETADLTNKCLKKWEELVQAYTHRSLTLPGDRILAISGIASQFGRILHDSYCAGLWRSNLYGQLLWICSAQSKLALRPSEYQGPSWSWTAVNSAIDFMPDRGQMDSWFEILGCKTELQNQHINFSYFDAKYGAVKSGLLTVKGRIWPVELLQSNDGETSSNSQVLRLLGTEDQKSILPARIHPDAIEEEFINKEGGTILAYLLNVEFRVREEVRRGLILRRKNNNEYVRLGVFELGEYRLYQRANETPESRSLRYQGFLDQFDRCEPQIITIV